MVDTKAAPESSLGHQPHKLCSGSRTDVMTELLPSYSSVLVAMLHNLEKFLHLPKGFSCLLIAVCCDFTRCCNLLESATNTVYLLALPD